MYAQLPTAEKIDFETVNSWNSLLVTHKTPRHFSENGESCRQGLVVHCEPNMPEAVVSKEEVEDGIRDAFRQECSCEHDCCGHVNMSVRNMRRLSGDRFLVVLTGFANI